MLALCLLLPAGASGGEIASVGVDDRDAGAYWTADRMEAAKPARPPAPAARAPREVRPPAESGGEKPRVVDPVASETYEVARLQEQVLEPETMASYSRSQVTDPRKRPFRTHGKVFFSLGGGDYVCSGTAVSSNNQSVVWTAGHCLFERGPGFARNWIFVPAYHDGQAPFGRWPARRLAAPAEWRQEENLKFDLGAAIVRRNGDGQALHHVVGSRGIGFDQPRSQRYAAFGYPSAPPFTGNRMYRCDAPLGGSDNPGGDGPPTMWIGCDMTAGASGGGWVADGRVLSVISYSYCVLLLCEDRLYGPYQSSVARSLYRSVRGKAHFCKGERVTHLGTGGDDKIIGTSRNDVIKARGGDDVIKARGRKDLVCAGPGNDVVRGGPGRDRLHGGGGNDRLVGGPGRDFCNGGPGRDRARGCERTKNIP